MKPRESPKESTSGVLRLFVYGTLKREYWNHDPFCRGVLAVQEAQVRGRLFEGPGFPVLEVPDEDILAHGTGDPLADVGTQARLVRTVASQTGLRKHHSRRLGRRLRGVAHLRRSTIPPACHRRAGGLPSRRFQLVPPCAGARHGPRSPGTRLGLHGRGDPHQTVPDRIRLLAEVTRSLSGRKHRH